MQKCISYPPQLENLQNQLNQFGFLLTYFVRINTILILILVALLCLKTHLFPSSLLSKILYEFLIFESCYMSYKSHSL